MSLTENLNPSPEAAPSQPSYRSSRLAHVTNLMWHIEHGLHVRQESLDQFGLTLGSSLAHLAIPRAHGSSLATTPNTG